LINLNLFIELLAASTGVASVWFAKRNSIWVYPVGLVSVLLYVQICYQFGLYADMVVNAYYFIISVYGWYHWTHKSGEKKDREIGRLSHLSNLLMALGSIGLTYLIFKILQNYTDSTVPLWDAFSTSMFVFAMLAMALRKIEHWIYWIIGDLVAIPLFLSKELMLTSIQYFFFLILAVWGFVEWMRLMKKNEV
jgi:nicotinamide mononucleotide transporter